MTGKEKCKILREIRRRIAEENGIEYAVEDCKHKGNCRGTCPKCESDVRYLEAELEKRRTAGKRVAVASLALSIAILSGCEKDSDVSETSDKEASSYEELMGDYPVGTPTAGVPLPSDTEEQFGQFPAQSDLHLPEASGTDTVGEDER